MKKIAFIFLGILLYACQSTTYKPLEVVVPERPAGQTDVIGLTAEKIENVRVGFIGLGMRGPGAVERFTHLTGVEIKALCDLHADRVEKCQAILRKAGLPDAAGYSGSQDAWKQLCERPDLDLVYIATDWVNHAPMILYAMEQGKHVVCEVPSAMTMEDIWAIINTAERTRKHCMQLENCVYDFFELTTLNMAHAGVFGDILHVEGAYIHNLEPFWDAYEGNWRMDYNQKHRGDIYATHGMGPACQLLDIHRGDRMKTLVSMDTDPVSIPNWLKARGRDAENFQNGDHTMTMIRTEKGRTIHIQHDVANLRPYSRMYQLTGSKGFANKYPREGYVLEGDGSHSFLPDAVRDSLMTVYKHPIQVELEEKAKQVGGHGGMDFIMDYRLIYCLHNGLPLDMDVYDLAEWCCMAPLSALSIQNGSAPVAVPDFTRGAWDRVKGYRHAFAE